MWCNCTPLHCWCSNVYRMRRERSTRFNLTTTSSRRRPSTNSRKRQRRKSPTSNPAPIGEHYTIFFGMPTMGAPLWLANWLLASGDVEQNTGPQKKPQLTGLVWHDHSTRHLFAGPMIQAFPKDFMVQPCGGGWPPTTLDGCAVYCWRRSKVRSELRPDAHKVKKVNRTDHGKMLVMNEKLLAYPKWLFVPLTHLWLLHYANGHCRLESYWKRTST